jgi:hypothetical protein
MMSNLAGATCVLGDTTGAQALARQAFLVWRAVLVDDHPATLERERFLVTMTRAPGPDDQEGFRVM